MNDSPTQDTIATQDAIAIWEAGVDAVSSERLVANVVQCEGSQLSICGELFDLETIGRIAVVGAGKAGVGMSAALLDSMGTAAQKVTGWVNVPADCVRDLDSIVLHAARPAGVNEPTAEGVFGSAKIFDLITSLDENDLCIVLLSGGGSALLPAPIDGVSLADKQSVTRQLMHGGASIGELNSVRKKLSNLKGGGLARNCQAGKIRGLIISDVIGDPLDVIASGPTTDDTSSIEQALEILDRVIGRQHVAASILQTLEAGLNDQSPKLEVDHALNNTVNHVIGNNEIAVHAAARKAQQLGYEVVIQGIGQEGIASQVGVELASLCLSRRKPPSSSIPATASPIQPASNPVCFLSGGEPIVRLAETDKPRQGGRNQELVLAALQEMQGQDSTGIVILSGGTDGEDGPTDAAGAWVDSEVIQRASELGLDPRTFLSINDSYNFFRQAGGLLKTGPTHTNVMDVRVAICR